jgi:uncharacterized tellurite resistance protein B-like protein
MANDPEKHEALRLPVHERADYLTVVAAMLAADGVVDPAELAKLRELCKALELPVAEMGDVLANAEHPSPERVRTTLSRLRDSDLKFSLMTDCIFMAYADGRVAPEEEAEIRSLSDALGISMTQVAALRRYVEAVNQAVQGKVPPDRAKKLVGEAIASAASVGVPIGAIAVSGSVFGLSAAGITSGLAALGLGLGMATGVGVAVGIGIGSYFGVRWLYKRVLKA